MNLCEIGRKTKETRSAMGFTQEQVAKFAGLSRTTVNQLENGTLDEIGYNKLVTLMSILGLSLDAKPAKGIQNALSMAARTASTSYKDILSPSELSDILNTGTAPKKYYAHMMTLLDETPLPIIVKAITEASNGGQATKQVMQNIATLAKQFHTHRKVW